MQRIDWLFFDSLCRFACTVGLWIMLMGADMTDAYASDIAQTSWQKVAITNTVSDARPQANDPFFIELPATELAGKWLRASAQVHGNADLLPLVHGFRDGQLVSVSTPRQCVVDANESRVCETVAWMPPEATAVRVRWWNRRDAVPPRLTDIRLEIWQGRTSNEVTAQTSHLIKRIRDLYFLSDQVQWDQIAGQLYPMLSTAPLHDSLPQIAAYLLRQLPDTRHMKVMPILSNGDGQKKPGVTCRREQGWVTLLLPPTLSVNGRRAESAYIEHAHACLMQSAKGYVLDLRQASGGDAQLMLAALAPVLVPGKQFSYQGRDKQLHAVEVSNNAVSLAGRVHFRFRSIRQKSNLANVKALIGSGCVSACEAVALALKGRVTLMGQPTAGVVTVNERVELSRDFVLPVTSGWMVSREGVVQRQAIEPDQILNLDE